MNMNLKTTRGIRAFLAAMAVASATLLAHAAPPPPKSPVLTNGFPAWDCIISGQRGERGILFITFTTNDDGYGNYSFIVRQVHTKVIRPAAATTTVGTARGGVSSGRGDTTSSGAPPTDPSSWTNIFGYWTTTGSWSYDAKGRILGIFTELVIDGVTDTNVTYITNRVSFTAQVVPNKRFNAIYSSSIGGNGTYRGVPMKEVTDLTGHWTGTEQNGKVTTYELFSMSPAPTPEGITNMYDFSGIGPGYELMNGVCLVSRQKKLAFASYKYFPTFSPTNAALQRATFGPLIDNRSSLGSNMRGLLDGGSNTVYKAFWASP